MVRSAILVVLLSTAWACGNSPSGLLDDYIDTAEEIVDALCECDEDPDECRDSADFDVLDDNDCVEAAFEIDEDGVTEALECNLEAIEEYDDCLDDNLTCDDISSLERCDSVLDRVDSCPVFPERVNDALAECDADFFDIDDD